MVIISNPYGISLRVSLASVAVNNEMESSWVYPFGDSYVLYYTVSDRLLVLNPTGKLVWEMLREGYGLEEISSTFAQHFSIPEERALEDIRQIYSEFGDLSIGGDNEGINGVSFPLIARTHNSLETDQRRLEECGTFRFGESLVRVISSVAEVDRSYFSRFHHRSRDNRDVCNSDTLEISLSGRAYQLIFRGGLVGEAGTTAELISLVVKLLLELEHPNAPLLAYSHAGAVSRNGRSLLMQGGSGVGKSTLTAFLVANGFAYLGDDTIAIGENDASLLPLPTCLSIKSGSWGVLEEFYPVLPQLPIVSRYSRVLRYVEPQQNYQSVRAAVAPVAIVFPQYEEGKPTRLTALTPSQTMIRLIGAHARLSTPATQEKLAKLLSFVQHTPGFDINYSDLPSALTAIEELLAAQTHNLQPYME